MAEQTFKSPGFFEREIEVISRPLFKSNATPVGLIGPSQRGPAFVPTTVTSREEFIRIFGAPDRNRLSGHAMAEFFRNNGKALTFCRTLGGGLKDSANAGFKMTAKDTTDYYGAPHFIVAQHTVDVGEHIGLGIFNDNDSHETNFNLSSGTSSSQDADGATVELIRAMIFTHKDYKVEISATGTFSAAGEVEQSSGIFVIRFKSASDATDELEVSLDPDSDKYIRNVLNTDPFSLEDKKHLLYAHFPVDSQVASTTSSAQKVAVVRGKDQSHANAYGNFSSRFNTPQTTKFISQPFGSKEFDLFHFESLDDGAYASAKYKVSIKNMRASTDPTDKFGTFTVAIRDLRDTDESQIVYETFSNCSLDPDAENFVARVIGDEKVFFNFDADSTDERRLVREGSFSSKSSRVRIVMSDDVLNREVPDEALPFGFRGVPALLSNSKGMDEATATLGAATLFLDGATTTALDHSVLPPLPYRFKVTNGTIQTGTSYGQKFLGEASPSETVNTSLHWGLMSTRVKDINNANSGKDFNEILENYTKFFGADTTVISSGNLSDTHNNNKFSLSKVALSGSNLSLVEGTISEVFKDAVYVRNADIGKSQPIYDVAENVIFMDESTDTFDPAGDKRVTLAKLLDEDKNKFNRYSSMIKFTAPFHGGFDGLNMFDKDSFFMTDQASSTEPSGKAAVGGFSSALKGTDDTVVMQGVQDDNNIVASYKNAIRIMTDELVVTHNVLAIPGIRDSFITDFAKDRVEEYGRALYLMEIPQYDSDDTRIFVSSTGIESSRPDVDTTASRFNSREINSSYTASYFPDVKVIDSGDDDEAAINNRRVIKIPPTIVALGALAKTDNEAHPWFAPAGFSRGALESVSSIDVRLNAEDRDTLYEARINPIANFPNKQFVIFGQKTSQLARTALDRVNVRRLVLEVKRRIGLIAQSLLFEQNNDATRQGFIASATSQLASVQINQGIEDFRVIMDDTNNSTEDVDNNRLNGKIIIVPTRAVEFIAIDFVITNAGVEFP